MAAPGAEPAEPAGPGQPAEQGQSAGPTEPPEAVRAGPPLQWGVSLMPEGPVAEVARLAARAERLGFDRCWVFDEGLATREVYVTLTAVALATERIGIGPGITNPYTRHPSVAAAAIASINELSGGRAFLGLGAGGSVTLDPIEMDRPRPAATLRESIEAIRALFGGEAVTYEGSRVRLRQARLDYGHPAIPIWVAGRGPRVLAAGGELADGVSLDHIHCDFLAAQVDLVRSAAASAGNEAEIAYATTLVVTDADLEQTKRHMTYRLADSPPEVRAAIGLGDGRAAAIREASASEGLEAAARLLKDEWVLPFVVHGAPAACAARIVELAAEHGLSEITIPVLDLPLAEETMDATIEIARLVESMTSDGPQRS